jgi:hypothetical protein
MRKIFVLIIIWGLLISLNSCAMFSKKDETVSGPQGIEPQLSAKFSDLPIPAGFKFLYKHSYSFQSGNVRMAVFRYSGRRDADKVTYFYKQQMPLYNWDLMNSIEYGTRLLNFERDNESCIITIQPKTFTTLITISLGPKRSVVKKAEKPVK